MNRPYRGRRVRVGGRSPAADGRRRRKASGTRVFIAALVVVAAAACVVYFAAFGGKGKAQPDADASAAADLSAGTIYDGVWVDGISLGGFTREQAKEKVEANQKEYVKKTGVTVTNDKQKVTYTISELPYTFDTDAVIGEAWAVGRTGTDAERKEAVRKLAETPVYLTTRATVDTAGLEPKIRELAEPYAVAPVDAKFLSYNADMPDGQRLTFSSDVPGSGVDADALWAAVKKEFDDGTYGTVRMRIEPIQAKYRLADLQGNMRLIGECDTYLSNHKIERYTNIRISGEAISGTILLPGETFSFNETTGMRTEAKGYLIAPIDNQGVEDMGLAGGVCQVSGTLYNACVRAGLEVAERNHHSIPSLYLAKGRDATVDYDKDSNKDLKIKNNKDKPVLIIVHFGTGDGKDKYTLYAEIYGPPFPDDIDHYDLAPDKDYEIIPPKEGFRVVASRNVLPGTTQVVNAHEGYVVRVYMKTVYKDGSETLSDQPVYTDTYDSSCQVVVYYYEDPPPTGVPTPTPSPTPSPAPEATQAPSDGTAGG